MTDPTTPAPLLTTYDVARVLRVTEATVRRYVRCGLPHARPVPGGHILFDWPEVEVWLRRGADRAPKEDEGLFRRPRGRRLT